MNLQQNSEDPFLRKIIGIILDNLENDQFGVSMLGRETGMSRSNLHRKVRALTGKSVNRLISETRLEHANCLLSTAATIQRDKIAGNLRFLLYIFIEVKLKQII